MPESNQFVRVDAARTGAVPQREGQTESAERAAATQASMNLSNPSPPQAPEPPAYEAPHPMPAPNPEYVGRDALLGGAPEWLSPEGMSHWNAVSLRIGHSARERLQPEDYFQLAQYCEMLAWLRTHPLHSFESAQAAKLWLTIATTTKEYAKHLFRRSAAAQRGAQRAPQRVGNRHAAQQALDGEVQEPGLMPFNVVDALRLHQS